MRRLLLLTGVAVLALFAGTATATPPAAVELVALTGFEGPGPFDFTATGPAVDAGLICPAGYTIDLWAKGAGFPSERGVNVLMVKRFTCDDGSGSFDVKLAVRIDWKGDNFNWVIVGGAGAYEHLRGTGEGFGIYPDPPTMVIDNYAGGVHVD